MIGSRFARSRIDSQHGFDRGLHCNVILPQRPVLDGEQ